MEKRASARFFLRPDSVRWAAFLRARRCLGKERGCIHADDTAPCSVPQLIGSAKTFSWGRSAAVVEMKAHTTKSALCGAPGKPQMWVTGFTEFPLSPLRGFASILFPYPRLAPWAALFRRFAACASSALSSTSFPRSPPPCFHALFHLVCISEVDLHAYLKSCDLAGGGRGASTAVELRLGESSILAQHD